MRLAQTRGSLTAPNSPVQDRALEYLLLREARQQATQRVDALKIALAANPAPPERLKALFPEYFPEDPFEEARREDGTYDIDRVDDSKIAWETPADPSVDEEISAWIASRERGSVSAEDLDDGWK